MPPPRSDSEATRISLDPPECSRTDEQKHNNQKPGRRPRGRFGVGGAILTRSASEDPIQIATRELHERKRPAAQKAGIAGRPRWRFGLV